MTLQISTVLATIAIGLGTFIVYRVTLGFIMKSAVRKAARCIFVIGSQGAGKGTQSQMAVESNRNIRHYSCGDLLRSVSVNHPHSQLIRDIIAKDGITPVQITLEIMKQAMDRDLSHNEDVVFLIDGFPRNQDNLDGWNRFMDGQGVALKGVILLNVHDEVAKQRVLERNRDHNDREEGLDGRIARRKD